MVRKLRINESSDGPVYYSRWDDIYYDEDEINRLYVRECRDEYGQFECSFDEFLSKNGIVVVY